MMVMGWFKKSGYLIPGEAPRAIELDPNAGVENRCTLPKNATFQRREHVACYDSEGQLKREKKMGIVRKPQFYDPYVEKLKWAAFKVAAFVKAAGHWLDYLLGVQDPSLQVEEQRLSPS